jgi:hypothetical protein
MTKPWTEYLEPLEVTFMNSIIEQVPTAMGARDAFVTCLQGLADSSAAPRLRFIIAYEGDVTGTNDEVKARDAADDEEAYVIDVGNMRWLINSDSDDDSDILEVK